MQEYRVNINKQRQINYRLRPEQQALPEVVKLLGVPIFSTLFLTATSINENSFVQVFLAFILLLIPWISYQRWREKRTYGPPLFAMIAAMHWLYFAVALFWGNRVAPVWYSSNNIVPEESITATLFMVVLGMSAIGLGYSIKQAKFISIKQPSSVQITPKLWDYVRLLLIIGSIIGLFPGLLYIFGEGGRQWIVSFQTTMPLLAFVLLLRKYFQKQATQLDTILILFYIVVQILTGLSTGWSGTVFYLGVTIGLIYLYEHKKIPTLAVIMVLILSIFLQPGKSSFRQAFWYDTNLETGIIQRITYWVEESFQSWQEALSDPTGQEFVSYLRGSLLRVSLLTQAADVYTKTPSLIPYQGANLYSFSIAGLIPRFLWPDKPSASEANQFYQVAYGISRPDNLANVSFAIGYLTEAYISFSWYGVVIVMFVLGIFFRFIVNNFFLTDSTIGQAIGIVAITSLLTVETQLGFYFVTTIQSIVVCYIFLFPIIGFKRSSRISSQVIRNPK